ncbi:hypothetical protein [Amycolatopsis sp. NBC_01286]|uniref:hypothetical protein n=1 Tax=Amycolatopsis sp. NBC_01286 TaxID=2903560 RepID=UPI002E122ABE|nr:hypothetical protein OG570_02370 [Amycolatopsis sp. NBC_01286]
MNQTTVDTPIPATDQARILLIFVLPTAPRVLGERAFTLQNWSLPERLACRVRIDVATACHAWIMAGHRDDLPVLTIDGACFLDFDGFTREFSRLLRGYTWRGNLDAFDDILGGGFGTPDNGWVLRWLNSGTSRSALGYEATVRRREQLLLTCHPSNRPTIQAEVVEAKRGEGPTLFDEIVGIIREHGPDGDGTGDGIRLELL